MRQILILGGTGWLGRTLATHLIADGADVTGVARGISGQIPDGHGRRPGGQDDARDLRPSLGLGLERGHRTFLRNARIARSLSVRERTPFTYSSPWPVGGTAKEIITSSQRLGYSLRPAPSSVCCRIRS